MTSNNSRKEVEEFFDEMDRDFDGRLSFAEFMGEETPLEKLFKSMDKNGDGTVTKEVGRFWNFRQFLNLRVSQLCHRIYVCTTMPHDIPGVRQHLQESDQRAGVKIPRDFKIQFTFFISWAKV